MSGHGGEPELKGMLKYFNSTTDLGRRNFAAATYAALGMFGLYLYLKPKKVAEPAQAK